MLRTGPDVCCLPLVQVRDISTNQEWQDAMHLAVPVLAALDRQGREVVLPRPTPRVSADRIERDITAALAGVDIG
jgi:hypothetical protein